MSAERRLADVPLLSLFALALLFVSGLALLVAGQSIPSDPLAACARVVDLLAARLTTLGLVAPTAILSVVLLAGLLALAHQLLVTRAVLRGVMRGRVPLPPRLAALAETAGLRGRIDLVDDPGVFVFCYGYARPRVCVTSGVVALLDDDELTAVLSHESHHARYRDPLKILTGRSLASALFFLPVAGALRNGYLAGKELCADHAAQSGPGGSALPGALVKMLGAERPTWPAGVLAVGALSPTEARIHNLIDPEEQRRTLPPAVDWIVSLALIAGIFGFSYGSAAAHDDPAAFPSCSSPTALTLR